MIKVYFFYILYVCFNLSNQRCIRFICRGNLIISNITNHAILQIIFYHFLYYLSYSQDNYSIQEKNINCFKLIYIKTYSTMRRYLLKIPI